MLRVLVLVAFAGCAAPGEPIAKWTLEVDNTRWRVELPSKLFGELPMREAHFTLRTDVKVPPGQHGLPLTLAIDCFHSSLGLMVDGVRVPDIGDTGVGEHRFPITAAMTNRDRMTLVLDVQQDRLSLGFGLVPRLVHGVDPGRTTAAKFNRYTAIVELALIGAFGILYLAMWLFTRRRSDAAFVWIATFTAFGPLWQLGLMPSLFGPLSAILLGVALCGADLAVLYFLHETYDLGRPPRWLVRPFLGLAVLSLGSPLSYKIAFTISAGFMIASSLLSLYLIWRLIKLVRTQHRFDAILMLGVIVITSAVIIPDLLGLFFNVGILGGLHTVSLGIVAFAVTQAIVLARQHALRQRELERTHVELQRQIADRSKELAEALAQLAQRSARALEVDRVIADRYRVVSKLGAGGMGAVYEVERLSDGRRLALKTLRGRADPDLQARFAREAQIAAEISHDNLVPVLDIGVADGGLYLVMPLVEGGSLEHHRKKFGDPKWALPLIAQIADGLAALHARGIIHRDLKPGNVLVAGGNVRIADFGLAALREDDAATQATVESAFADTAVGAPSPPLTRAGDIFGTPNYMAPELAKGARDVTAAVDIFALGVIAFEMLAGKAPYTEPVVYAHMHNKPITPPTFDAIRGAADGADHDRLRTIVERCLHIDPDARPTAAEISAAISTP